MTLDQILINSGLDLAKQLNNITDKTERAVLAAAALTLFETVKKPYESVVRDQITASSVYHVRGYAKQELGRPEEALADYDKALELEPSLVVTYHERGFVKQELGRLKEALADYDIALELEPQDAVTYHNRGFVKLELGRSEEAWADFNKALELEPHSSHSYSWRAGIYEQKGNQERAIADYQTALQQLQEIPLEKLNKYNIKHLIKASEGLTQLGIDHSEDLQKYRSLAEERGYPF